MRYKAVQVGMIGPASGVPQCMHRRCPLANRCANYLLNGPSRVWATGMTPDLRRRFFGRGWKCAQRDTGRQCGLVTVGRPRGRPLPG
jgi:hypothetical protein